jgi:hypothetical protein
LDDRYKGLLPDEVRPTIRTEKLCTVGDGRWSVALDDTALLFLRALKNAIVIAL